jgi:Leucine-rich repeat (LRR) protein
MKLLRKHSGKKSRVRKSGKKSRVRHSGKKSRVRHSGKKSRVRHSGKKSRVRKSKSKKSKKYKFLNLFTKKSKVPTQTPYEQLIDFLTSTNQIDVDKFNELNDFDKKLYLKDISVLQYLSEFTQYLRTIIIENQQIKDITPLKSILPQIKTLSLSNNKIQNIEVFRDVKANPEKIYSLTNIDLSNNQIQDITPLNNLGQEYVLWNLSNNNIKNVSNLVVNNIDNLSVINLNGNNFTINDATVLKNKYMNAIIHCDITKQELPPFRYLCEKIQENNYTYKRKSEMSGYIDKSCITDCVQLFSISYIPPEGLQLNYDKKLIKAIQTLNKTNVINRITANYNRPLTIKVGNQIFTYD